MPNAESPSTLITIKSETMQDYLRKFTVYLIPVVSLFCNSSFADSTRLEKAIETYYAGYPGQAIGMIKPLAVSGDVNAQYLLGNILYGLSNAGQYSDVEDPIKWYKMAAEQGSVAANYALGVIYNNRWSNTHQQQDAEQARLFSQKAADQGHEKARELLNKLELPNKSAGKSTSLSYTNSSFSSKQKASEKPPDESKTVAAKDALADFRRSENPVADLVKLRELFNRLSSGNISNGDQSAGNLPDEAMISNLLSRFESTDKLVADLVKLLAEIKSVGNHTRLSGAN